MKSEEDIESPRRARRYSFATLVAVLLMGTLSIGEAKAGRITMSDPQEETTADGRRVCIYSNSIYTFTTVTRSQNCPYSKTFDTEDSD